jgi:hypothetical protein
MKQVLIGAAVCAVAMFLWGFLFWAATPLPYAMVMKVAPDELAVGQKLKDLLPASGVYLIPSPASGVSTDEMGRRQLAGPAAQIIFNRDGITMGAGTFLAGLAHYFASALIVGLLLLAALPAAPTFGARAKLVFLAGLAGSVFSDLGKPIWWHYPWSYSVLDFSYDATIWLIGALILAKFVRSQPQER